MLFKRYTRFWRVYLLLAFITVSASILIFASTYLDDESIHIEVEYNLDISYRHYHAPGYYEDNSYNNYAPHYDTYSDDYIPQYEADYDSYNTYYEAYNYIHQYQTYNSTYTGYNYQENLNYNDVMYYWADFDMWRDHYMDYIEHSSNYINNYIEHGSNYINNGFEEFGYAGITPRTAGAGPWGEGDFGLGYRNAQFHVNLENVAWPFSNAHMLWRMPPSPVTAFLNTTANDYFPGNSIPVLAGGSLWGWTGGRMRRSSFPMFSGAGGILLPSAVPGVNSNIVNANWPLTSWQSVNPHVNPRYYPAYLFVGNYADITAWIQPHYIFIQLGMHDININDDRDDVLPIPPPTHGRAVVGEYNPANFITNATVTNNRNFVYHPLQFKVPTTSSFVFAPTGSFTAHSDHHIRTNHFITGLSSVTVPVAPASHSLVGPGTHVSVVTSHQDGHSMSYTGGEFVFDWHYSYPLSNIPEVPEPGLGHYVGHTYEFEVRFVVYRRASGVDIPIAEGPTRQCTVHVGYTISDPNPNPDSYAYGAIGFSYEIYSPAGSHFRDVINTIPPPHYTFFDYEYDDDNIRRPVHRDTGDPNSDVPLPITPPTGYVVVCARVDDDGNLVVRMRPVYTITFHLRGGNVAADSGPIVLTNRLHGCLIKLGPGDPITGHPIDGNYPCFDIRHGYPQRGVPQPDPTRGISPNPEIGMFHFLGWREIDSSGNVIDPTLRPATGAGGVDALRVTGHRHFEAVWEWRFTFVKTDMGIYDNPAVINPLPGAVFDLYRINNAGAPVHEYEANPSDILGRVHLRSLFPYYIGQFSGTPPDPPVVSFRLYETVEPTGYTRLSDYWIIRVNMITGEIDEFVTPSSNPYFTRLDINSLSISLGGQLSGDTPQHIGYDEESQVGDIYDNGLGGFINIAPASEDERYVWHVGNEPIPSPYIYFDFIKFEHLDPALYLDGVLFQLYRIESDGSLVNPFAPEPNTQLSGPGGLVSFRLYKGNTYQLKEILPLPNFLPAQGHWEIYVCAAGTISITVVGSPPSFIFYLYSAYHSRDLPHLYNRYAHTLYDQTIRKMNWELYDSPAVTTHYRAGAEFLFRYIGDLPGTGQLLVSDSNGFITLPPIVWGMTYVLEEITPPPGYLLPVTPYWYIENDPWSGTINMWGRDAHPTTPEPLELGAGNWYIGNMRAFEFFKGHREYFTQDTEDWPPLDGAVFELDRWTYENNEWAWVTVFTSDPSGTCGTPGRVEISVRFQPNTRYRLRETVAPPGFSLASGYWVFETDAGGYKLTTPWLAGTGDYIVWICRSFSGDTWLDARYVQEVGWHLPNIRTRDWPFYKTDWLVYTDFPNREFLPDSTFILVVYNGPPEPGPPNTMVSPNMIGPAEDGYLWSYVATQESGPQGSPMEFPMMVGRHYRLIEAVPPPGFMPPDGQWHITVSVHGISFQDGLGLNIAQIRGAPPVVVVERSSNENVYRNPFHYIGNRAEVYLPLSGGPGANSLTRNIAGGAMVGIAGVASFWLIARKKARRRSLAA
ncbi:MAG: prealbumin-like fold domain-containing protein [Defluviitaleaceae bacterium]|nr:prealbumin-like fold domain-containing protein [Defluviitaleaceae bacterium]